MSSAASQSMQRSSTCTHIQYIKNQGVPTIRCRVTLNHIHCPQKQLAKSLAVKQRLRKPPLKPLRQNLCPVYCIICRLHSICITIQSVFLNLIMRQLPAIEQTSLHLVLSSRFILPNKKKENRNNNDCLCTVQ